MAGFSSWDRWRGLALSLIGLALAGGTARAAGLRAEYFDNADFTTLRLTATNPVVSFNWGTGTPVAGVGADTFSVRWSGQVEPQFSETHVFHVTADDGARLWVNDRLVAARWLRSGTNPELQARVPLQAGRRYNLVLEYVETTGNASVSLEWSSPSLPRQILPASRLEPLPVVPERGRILAEHWTGVPGTNLTAFTALLDYPQRPRGREYLLSFESLRPDWADAYGARVSGYVVPPVSGSYVFAVAADDTAQLWLSRDANPANRQRVASVPAPTGVREFTRYPEQRSAPVSLGAGQSYYVELLHKEDAGPDHFEVAWQVPGTTTPVVIPGEVLVPAGLHRAAPAKAAFLDSLAQGHPRLLASAEQFAWLRTAIASNALPPLTTAWQSVSNAAQAVLAQPVSVYTQDVRGTILDISRKVQTRVLQLGLAWQITGRADFAERAWAELEAAAGFPDWHPPHFLDTAEMTAAVGLGYDWLFEYWTPARREVLRAALVQKGLNEGLKSYTNNAWYFQSTANNWNLVCNGGLTLGALALGAEQETMVEEVLSRAVASALPVMRHYAADQGGWYEGPGYWDYTTTYNVFLMAGLEGALGFDCGLSDVPGLAETGLFAIHFQGPTRLSFNFADAGAGSLRGEQLLWFSRRFFRPEYAGHQFSTTSRGPLDLIWFDSRGGEPARHDVAPDQWYRGPAKTTSFPPADALALRSGWEHGDVTFLGFKTGEMGASHGHLDAGSFVLDALGRRWVHDLGGDSYALTGYFGSERWKYYRLRAEGHNTLVINPDANPDQNVGAQPPVLLFRSDPDGDRSQIVADLTSAYDVTRVWRGLTLFNRRRWVLVQDEVQAASPATVWWFLHLRTNAAATFAPDGRSVTLTESGDRLWIRILSGQGTLALSNAVPLPSSPVMAGQNSNASYAKLAVRLTNVVQETLAVLFVPLEPGEIPPRLEPAIRPLSEWGWDRAPAAAVGTTNVASAGSGPVDVDLRPLLQGMPGDPALARLGLGPASTGTVSLLPDGRTARYAPPPLFLQPAVFPFTATARLPDPRLLLHYPMEVAVAGEPARVVDESGHFRDGFVDTLGTGSFAGESNAPVGFAPTDVQSLRLLNPATTNAARLSHVLPKSWYDLADNDWTFAAWFRRESTTTDDYVFYVGNGDGFSGSGDELQLYAPRNQSTLNLRHWNTTNGEDINLVSPAIVGRGQWHHTALVFDRTATNTGAVQLYLDGQPVGAPLTRTWALNQSAALRFGGHASAGALSDRWFDGALDDVALFAAALTAADVQQLAAAPAAYLTRLTATNTVTVYPPPPQLSLVDPGASWRFLDTGADPGSGWTSAGFADTAWPEGPAPLGFGNGDEATRVAADPARVTTYFRRAFVVPEGTVFSNLTARLQRDDGAEVSLNGTEVWRSNLPTNGPIAATTPALTEVNGADEGSVHQRVLDPALLQAGLNVLAVAAHQAEPPGGDLRFSLGLVGQVDTARSQPVMAAGWSGAELWLSWPMWAAGWPLESATNLAPPVSWQAAAHGPTVTNGWVRVLPSTADRERYFRLRKP